MSVAEPEVKSRKRGSVVVESSDEDESSSHKVSQQTVISVVQLPLVPAVIESVAFASTVSFKPSFKKIIKSMFTSAQHSSDVEQGREAYASLIECNGKKDLFVSYMHPRCPRLCFSSSNHSFQIVVKFC